ncbi:MAG: hypothetical protein AB7V43_04015 [Acidimicrobiia bacterium]
MSSSINVFAAVGAGVLSAAGYAVRRGPRRRTHTDVSKIANAHGLGWGEKDPFGSSRLMFDRFNEGVERGFGAAVWDRDDPGQLRAFDFWWETEDSEGHRTRHWTTSVAGSLTCWCPYLTVRPEGLGTRIAATIAAKDIEVESEEFNRMFYVRCEDRAFATAMLSADMIELLLTTDGFVTFEVNGDAFLLTTKRARVDQYPGLLRLAAAVRSKVPSELADLYQPRFTR